MIRLKIELGADKETNSVNVTLCEIKARFDDTNLSEILDELSTLDFIVKTESAKIVKSVIKDNTELFKNNGDRIVKHALKELTRRCKSFSKHHHQEIISEQKKVNNNIDHEENVSEEDSNVD